MFTPQNIIFLCWGIFLFYWAINWNKVKPTQERKWGLSGIRWIIVLLIIIVVFISKRFDILPPCHQAWFTCLYNLFVSHISSLFVEIIGTVFTIIGLVIAVIARKTLADNWSATIDLKKDHKLITTGIYSYIRHPIYTGILLMGLGTVLVSPTLIVALIFLFIFGSFLFRIKNEEALMTKTFPKEYPSYKKRVKALIPFVI